MARHEVDQLIAHSLLKPGLDGLFGATDIQRVRAVMAMLSPGLTLDELLPVFRAGYITLEPIEMLFPQPAPASSQTFAALAGELGLTFEQLIRLVIAMGAPVPRAEDLVREDDAQLLRDVVLAGSLFGGGDLTLRAARILGDSARRAADAGLALFEEGGPMRSAEHREAMWDPKLRHEMNERGGRLMRLSEQLLAAMYRRHLEHALLRLWASAAERFLDEMGLRPAPETLPGLAFVDLAGFTALTESAGDAAAARLATQLGELAEQATARHSGRVVKLLGDGAMLYFDGPLDAARGALELVGAVDRLDLPPARGGAHAGPVIERDGDFFGRTVNTAARITALAEPGHVLVSAELAGAQAADLRFAPLGEREMKGVGRVALYEVAWASG